jgi:hypothetical protein
VPQEFTPRQRWNQYIAWLFTIIGILAGINLRDEVLYSTTQFIDAEVGISAQYPKDWLIDTQGDYVFRVRDISRIGYKTTIQITTRALGAATTSRNLFDSVNLGRYPVLAAYRVLSIDDQFVLPDRSQAAAMNYAYADAGGNTFLQDIPIVVRGIDILIIKRGQALIITFLSDASTFDHDYPTFERFLETLEF